MIRWQIRAAHKQYTGDSECLSAEKITLQTNPISVSAIHVHDRIDPGLKQEVRGCQVGNMWPRVGVVGDLDSGHKTRQLSCRVDNGCTVELW